MFAKYPSYSPYSYALNSPIVIFDPDGKDARVSITRNKGGGGVIKIQTVIHVTGMSFSNPWAQYSTNMYNENAKKAFQDGSYKDEKGNVWEIRFDVKYEYEKILNPSSVKPGDNVSLFENGNPNIDKDGRAITKGDHIFLSSSDQFGNTITHETGHAIGLTDRYGSFRFKDKNNVIQTGFLSHQGYKDNLMGGDGGMKLNQDQYNNWGKQLLKMADEKGTDNFILQGIIEYETDESGRNLKVPYTQVGEADKQEYINNYNLKLDTGSGAIDVNTIKKQ
jgi:transcriptional regulator CtsR